MNIRVYCILALLIIGTALQARADDPSNGDSPNAITARSFTGEAANDRFGYSVSSAGDVNGDGYDDLIVGAPNNDNGATDAGRVYIFFGETSMDTGPDVVITSGVTGNNFGNAVSGIGDVNGDGFDDVIVGAQFNDSGGSNAGRAYVFFGGAQMNNAVDVIMTGAAAEDRFGTSVSGAGDVNGDGFADIIVGAPLNDAGGSNAGRAYIFHGGAVVNDVADVILTGATAGDQLGNAVAGAGDVNGDGYSDVILGAPFRSSNGTNAGAAYVFFGGAAMDNVGDVVFSGESPSDFFGLAVSGAGDMNGDGYADMIVGAAQNDAGGPDAGRAYMYLGGPSLDNIADVTMTGEAANDYCGNAVSGAGDINGDGFADVIVGAYFNDAGAAETGRAYVLLGGAVPDNVVDAMFNGEATNDLFGFSVSGAGDVNGDGYAEVIVSAPYVQANDVGRVYLYFNSLTGFDLVDTYFVGPHGDAYLGVSTSCAGDVNGDGYPDIIVGASASSSSPSLPGSAHIYFGGETIDNVPDVVLTGEANGDQFGHSVAGAGDVNNDGYDDVIVGARYSDSGGAGSGRAYVYLGGSVMDTIPDVVITGAAGDVLGTAVSGAGDFNGDGFDDVVVGAHLSDVGAPSGGRISVYYGGSPMNANSDRSSNGLDTSGYYGFAVRSAGDFDRDGYDDVVIGAPGSFDNETGAAFIMFGGPAHTIGQLMIGSYDGESFGVSVSGAGDVNGDGFDDVIIGADENDAAGQDAGRAYIYFGSMFADDNVDVTLTGLDEFDRFGTSVSSAGDVNGDDYDDVIVGARGAHQGYIYFGTPSMENTVDIVLRRDGAQYASSVSFAGDINRDGLDDVIVGDPAYRPTGSGTFNTGRAGLYLSSSPSIHPAIRSVRDVPLDQGGSVLVRWLRSGYDTPGIGRLAEYVLQRSTPPGQNGFVWEYVATIPATREQSYAYVASTTHDSSANASGTFHYRVLARGTHPDEVWPSAPVAGHSVDNLAPFPPANVAVSLAGDDALLQWNANIEPDLAFYEVYRSSAAGFNPDTMTALAAPAGPALVDTTLPEGTPRYYAVRAVDHHGNRSAKSNEVEIINALTIGVPVFEKWNLVSLPVASPVPDDSVMSVFEYSESDYAFTFNGGYVQRYSLANGPGYWVKSTQSYNQPVIGLPVDSLAVAVSAGWNMVGSLSEAIAATSIQSVPPGIIISSFFGFNGSGYSIADDIIPGKGYWVKVSQSGSLIVLSPGHVSRPSRQNLPDR